MYENALFTHFETYFGALLKYWYYIFSLTLQNTFVLMRRNIYCIIFWLKYLFVRSIQQYFMLFRSAQYNRRSLCRSRILYNYCHEIVNANLISLYLKWIIINLTFGCVPSGWSWTKCVSCLSLFYIFWYTRKTIKLFVNLRY